MGRSNDQAATAWHARDIESAVRDLATALSGLSGEEAARRLRIEGPNRLPQGRKRGPLLRFALQFHNLLIYVLLGAAVLALLLDHAIDAGVIFAVVVANAAIGFFQEGRAEKSLEAIRGMIDPNASVLRDGRRVTIPAADIVPGDVVMIDAGDRVPADLRLVRARNLKVDEAILTGESVAADKAVAPVHESAELGDRKSMAFSGTFVAGGQGAGIAVATGAATELGRISALIGTVEAQKTPLIRQMDGFAKQLTVLILAVSAVAFLAAHFARGYPFAEAFMIVVGLAVAAIPEGLPAIMTITLAIGVRRMAALNAITRRLPAVETLGSVSVICSDKTGTLTRNEMTARTIVTAEGDCEVTGVGYEPSGGFLSAGDAFVPGERSVAMDLIRAALLCNDAEIRRTDGGWVADGDPMEGALVALATKAGYEPALLRRQMLRTDEIPFDAQHRFMATLHHHHENADAFIFVKGAPERIIEMCARERHAGVDRPLDAVHWHAVADALAAKGQRVLGFAMKFGKTGQRDLSFADFDRDAVLLGFIGFIDPPREEAKAAVQDCKSAGIRVMMITGDHAVTAREIGRQLGLAEDPKVMVGAALDRLDDEMLSFAVRDVDVFARVAPEHKLRLVRALQVNGLTVAMTGDGVNDAPALKRADVGVAMGRKGTEAAKEAAEIVLADDNFASIVAAVREGRTVYDNIMKVIGWTLPTNGGEALTILAAIALGLALPVTPVQILWINMITAVTLGLTLAFEPTEPGTMRRLPRPRRQPILTGALMWRIVFVSVLFVAGAFGVFFWAEENGLPVETARTLVVNTIVVMEIFYLFNVRYVHGTSLTLKGVVGTPAVLLAICAVVPAQLAFTYLPPLQAVFDTTPLTVAQGLVVLGIGVALLIVVELEKSIVATLGRAAGLRAFVRRAAKEGRSG